MTLTLLVIFATFLGLFFGSFASVILLRWKEAKSWSEAGSILRGRSECPQCKHQLSALDLIPVLSYLFSRAKCRHCSAKIPATYLFLELSTAIIFGVLSYFSFPLGIASVIFVVLTGWGLWMIFLYDIWYYELHLPVYFGLWILLLIPLRGGSFGSSTWIFFSVWLLSFLLLYGLGRALVKWKYQGSGEGFGLGDVLIAPYLAILLSSFFPSFGLRDVLLMLVIFFFFSGMLGLIHYLLQIKIFGHYAQNIDPLLSPKSLPFLPAMLLAGVILMIWGETILLHFF